MLDIWVVRVDVAFFYTIKFKYHLGALFPVTGIGAQTANL